MVQKKFDTIISDLGNVLINFDHRIAAKKILQHTPKKEEDIYNLFFDSPLTELYEKGAITTDEFFHRVKDFLKLDMDRDSFFNIWNDIFFEVSENLKMQKFLGEIKRDHKLIMISNLNETHFKFLRPKMPVFEKFDKLILSYEVGLRKPAPEIYKIALDAAKTVESRALYIDDRRDLIEAAEKLGIKGLVFDGNGSTDKVRSELDI